MFRDGYGKYWYDDHEVSLMDDADNAVIQFIQTIERESGITVAQAKEKDSSVSVMELFTGDLPDRQNAEACRFVSMVVLEIGETQDQIVIEFVATNHELVPFVTCDILGLNHSWEAYEEIKAMIIEDMKALKTN